MSPSNQATPTPNGNSRQGQGLTGQLRKMATPLRSTALRQLVLSSLPSFSRSVGESSTQIKPVLSGNPNNLAGWMSSIRKRAKQALLQDDSFEEETNNEIERSRREQEFADPESPPPSAAFEKLGQILESRKRPINSISHIETPFEKRQKMNEVSKPL